MTHAHVEDLAELYALGALGDDERASVEAHAGACRDCARAVASAERDVALIASLERRQHVPPMLEARIDRVLGSGTQQPLRLRKPSGWTMPAIAAAALCAGLFPSVYLWSEHVSMHAAMLAQSAAMERLASAPHRTTSFRSARSGPPAEVMYGNDGSWYVVVVRHASKPLAVAWMHDGTQTMLGAVTPSGNVAMLYLPQSHRMDRLALMDGGRVVAVADLLWQKTSPDPPNARSG